MFNTIKQSFDITNRNLIIVTPLIFFSLISSLYILFTSNGGSGGILFSLFMFYLMLGAFLSGWFFMITKAVKIPDIADRELIYDFPSGIGEYFLATLVMIIKVLIVSVAIMLLAFLAGKKFIGGIGVPVAEIIKASASVELMKTFVNSLSQEQLLKVNAWNMLIFFTMIINYFILMFYPAAIFFKNKNPFIAFFLSLKDIFGRRFFKNVLLFLFIFTIYIILSSLTMFLGRNIILHFVLTILNFYFMTFVGILVFNYYYSNFAKIGSAIDTTV